MTDERCELTDLLVGQCAHCQGRRSVEEQAADDRQPTGWITANFAGYCGSCGEYFEPGTRIRRITRIGWVAVDCCEPEP